MRPRAVGVFALAVTSASFAVWWSAPIHVAADSVAIAGRYVTTGTPRPGGCQISLGPPGTYTQVVLDPTTCQAVFQYSPDSGVALLPKEPDLQQLIGEVSTGSGTGSSLTHHASVQSQYTEQAGGPVANSVWDNIQWTSSSSCANSGGSYEQDSTSYGSTWVPTSHNGSPSSTCASVSMETTASFLSLDPSYPLARTSYDQTISGDVNGPVPPQVFASSSGNGLVFTTSWSGA